MLTHVNNFTRDGEKAIRTQSAKRLTRYANIFNNIPPFR